MPEHLAPGVYVEEGAPASRLIEGVETSTAAFAGPTRRGPVGGRPELLTAFGDFERIYGSLEDLAFSTHFVARAVKAYFENGGTRLYVSRVFRPSGAAEPHGISSGGDPGSPPSRNDYEEAFAALEPLDDVSMIAAPGHSAHAEWTGIQDALISHAERTRRLAVLDAPPATTVPGARDARARIDSRYAALYFPWVIVDDPLHRPGEEPITREVKLPPSGFVCGVLARTDVERGAWKAPAGEEIRGVRRLETELDPVQLDELNALGVNCLRSFPGRGCRVWGARTASSDPEWRYVHVRRYVTYLQTSIDRGMRWATFEPNGEALWSRVRETISTFLLGEWRKGALVGARPEEAFFVRCDRTTMTQTDLDEGGLVVLIGVAVLRPAEFVVLRISQRYRAGS